MPIYMNYDSIPGEVTPNRQKQWIELNSFQWAVTGGRPSGTGGAATREASTPSVSEIVITKESGYIPYSSLKNVSIVNLVGPPHPNSHLQPKPIQPRKAEPLPPWLKNVLIQLRPHLAKTGTIHLSGFQFDEKELSALAGVPVRASA